MNSHSSNPVVLITGASTGIGAETARVFAGRGFTVAASMRRPDEANAAAGDAPAGIEHMRLDVTDRASIQAAVDTVLARHGRIDVLVNNAGYGLIGSLEGLTEEQLSRQFATNVTGLIAVTQTVLPTMRRQRGGAIVNVSSIGGRLAFPFTSAYHATKWAVEGLSESLRFELAPFGIRVKVVEPGGIRTDFGTRSMELAVAPPYEAMTRRMLKLYRERNDQLPGPRKVAETIYRAATDRSARLRYPVHHRPYLTLHRLLPDALWRRLVGTMVDKPSAATAD